MTWPTVPRIALRAEGKVDDAIAEFREAIRLAPDDASTIAASDACDQGKVDEAIAEFREALRLTPDDASTHRDLGFALRAQGKVDEATAEFREALRLTPDNGADRTAHGEALRAAGKLDEAIAELHAALRLNPADAAAHHHLGEALAGQGKLDEAIAEYQTALRLRPNDGWAHHKLGHALAMQGKLDAGVAEYRQAIRLNLNNGWPTSTSAIPLRRRASSTRRSPRTTRRSGSIPTIRRPTAIWDEPCESRGITRRRSTSCGQATRWARSGVTGRTHRPTGSARPSGSSPWATAWPPSSGATSRPKDNAERLAVAQVYCDRNRPAAAARLMAEALEADPKLGDDLRTGLRYEAASAAALAGCGGARTSLLLTITRKAELRRQALDWLKLDLTLRSQRLATGTAEDRKDVARAMTRWKTAPTSAASATRKPWQNSPRPNARNGGRSGRTSRPS